MTKTRRFLLLGGSAFLLAAAVAVALPYRRDLRRFTARSAPSLADRLETRHGPLEYAVAGDGPTVLMLHGTGGGFDQGLIVGARMVEMGYRVIAPSRFGYLGTPMPPDANHWAEAEAMADLLDHLGLEQVAIAGGSAGAIPALAFAERFPRRTAALFPIVPALMIPGRPSVEPWSPIVEWAVMRALRSNLLFWAGIRLAPDQVIGSVLATDPALVHAASPAEQTRVYAMMESILPIRARTDGLLYDNTQTNAVLDLDPSRIRAPTLVVSAEDDRFLTAQNARYLARTIPGAESLIFPDGGHLWVGWDRALFDAIDAVLRRIGYA